MHWSESARGWLGLFASLSDGRMMLRHELTFRRTSPEDVADLVVRFCATRALTPPLIFAQPDIFPKKDARGETIAGVFRGKGIPLCVGDDDLVNGLSRIRSWLKLRTQADGRLAPSLVIHRDCTHAIRTLPTLVQVEGHPDEIDPLLQEAYPANGIRFYLMSRPMPAVNVELPEPGEGTWGHALRHVRHPRGQQIGDYLR
jgi:hypothetical protein